MSDEPITIHATMPPAAAEQLAQFCKRSTFQLFYDMTEAHLPHAERTQLAYQMMDGTNAVASALAEAGYAPR